MKLMGAAVGAAMILATAGTRAQGMPGMKMPSPPKAAKPPPRQTGASPPQSQTPPADKSGMPGMSSGQMGGMAMMAGQLGAYSMMRDASGTGWQPDATPMDGFTWKAGGWTGMVHGYADLVYDRQGGPRGDSQTFVEGMLMAMAQRPVGPGALTLRAML